MKSQFESYNQRHVAYSAVGPRLSEKRSKAIDISALIDGDARAWDRFVRSAGPIMKGVIYRLLSKSGREHESEDVLQAAFLKAIIDCSDASILGVPAFLPIWALLRLALPWITCAALRQCNLPPQN